MKLGFNIDEITRSNTPLRIGIIDADLLDGGTRHPNLALLKISGYCKDEAIHHIKHSVRLICSYDELREGLLETPVHYDILAMSRVFKFTTIPDDIMRMVENDEIYIGGTGFFEVNGPTLSDVVEHHMPDYHLYDEYIERDTHGDEALKKKRWDDYLNFSIGFTTRGCIRHCGFCVNRNLNRVTKWSPVSEFYDPTRKHIYLWDDNIMAAPPTVFRSVINELIATGKSFQFRQGMDIRLMTDNKAEVLKHAKYYGDYIFAFDHYRLDDPFEAKQVKDTIRGLEIWRKHSNASTKLYVLVAYDYQDERDIEGTFFRIKTLMEFGCLPYIMRFEKWKDSKYRDLYIQLARWCNQPSFFKKKSFRQFCEANEEYHLAHLKSKKAVGPCSSLRAMQEFEKEHPQIAKDYFDLRFDELCKYELKEQKTKPREGRYIHQNTGIDNKPNNQ